MAATNRHDAGSEFAIQKRLVQYITARYPDLLFCASAGGARTSMAEAKRLKMAGYRKGFPDLFVYEPRATFHGLAIELKRDKGGRVSAHQRKWIEDLKRRGYMAAVCHGFDQSIELLDAYLDQ